MHTYNNIHVLLSTLCYMFRRLLRYLQGELYRVLKTTVTLFGYISSVVLYRGLQLLFTVIYRFIQGLLTF